MHLYYAIGGGLGHLTRARKLINFLGIREVRVLTALTCAPNSLFSPEQLLVMPKEWTKTPSRVSQQIANWATKLDAKQLFIDTFPCGIRGEIDPAILPKNLRYAYVARYLNWSRYQSYLNNNLCFDDVYFVDQLLHPQQHDFALSKSKRIHHIQLDNLSGHIKHATLNLIEKMPRPHWLIVHSQPANELNELLAYAREISAIEKQDPSFIICSNLPKPQLNEHPEEQTHFYLNHFPAYDLFDSADRIITACGYNIMQETQRFNDKHIFLPFTRKFDDQYLRAKHRRITQACKR